MDAPSKISSRGEAYAPGDSAAVHVGGEESGGRLAVVETSVSPQLALPRHCHHWEDEVVYVLTGEIACWRGDAWRSYGAGQSVFVPRGTEHTVVALSDEARLLVTLTPAGFEGFYRELAGAGGPLPLDRLVALAARYGCEITGPCPGLPAGLSAHSSRSVEPVRGCGGVAPTST